MKNLIITITLIIAMFMTVACELEYVPGMPVADYDIEIGTIEDYDFENDIPEFKSIEQIYNFLQFQIEKKKDIDVHGIAEYFQLPEETWKIESGDCEDFSLLFQYIIKKQFNYDSDLIIVDQGKEYHAIVYIHNIDKFVDPISHCIILFNNTFSKKIEYSIPYSEALWMTKNYHQTIGKYRF